MRCHLSSGILILKSMCMIPTKYSTLVCTNLGGGLLYKLDTLRLTPFQAYHVCSSLIARKMEFSELSIILQISTTYCKWQKSNWLHHVDFILIFICFLHALYRLNSLEQKNCQLCICFAFHHMYTYIQGELSLYNVRVKFCNLFHSTYKGSQCLTLSCATNVFLFGV